MDGPLADPWDDCDTIRAVELSLGSFFPRIPEEKIMLTKQHFVAAGAPDHLVAHALAAGLGWVDLLKLLTAYGPALWTVVQAAVNSGWDLKAVLQALLAAIGAAPVPAPPVPTP